MGLIKDLMKDQFFYDIFIFYDEGGENMKGYYVPSGYMGWTGISYQLFETEGEYTLWYKEFIGD